MFRCAGFLAAVLALSSAPAVSAAEKEVAWSDSFTALNIGHYYTDGEVQYDKKLGGVRIGPGDGGIIRAAAMGFESEVRVEMLVRPAPLGIPGAKLVLGRRLEDGLGAELEILSDRPVLSVHIVPGKPAIVPLFKSDEPRKKFADETWVLKVRVRHGFIQVKAWRKDEPEPAKWSFSGMAPDSGFEPRFVGVITTGEASVVVRHLSVRGTPPASKLYLQPLHELLTPHPVFTALGEAVALLQAGKHDESEKKLRDAVTAVDKEYPANHPFTAIAREHMGLILVSAGKFEAAHPLFVKAHEIYERCLPADHPHIGSSLGFVAMCLRETNRPDEALVKFREALEQQRKALGVHAETAMLATAVARVLTHLERSREALPFLREALTIYRAVYDDLHEATAMATWRLGDRLQFLGDYEAARPVLQAAVKIYRDLYNTSHVDTANAEATLGHVYRITAEFDAARDHFSRAMRIYEKAGARHDLERAALLNQFALVAAETGDTATARTLYEAAIEVRRRVPGNGLPQLAVLEINLAQLLLATGDTELASQLAHSAIADLERQVEKKQLRPDDLSLGLAYDTVSYMFVGETPESNAAPREMAEKALTIAQTRLGPTHPQTLRSRNTVALFRQLTGDLAGAREELTEIHRLAADKLGPNHPLTAVVGLNLGDLDFRDGKFDEAETRARQGIASFEKAYGPRHPYPLAYRMQLAKILAAQAKQLEALRFPCLPPEFQPFRQAAQEKHAEALREASRSSTGTAAIARDLFTAASEAQQAQFLAEWGPRAQMYLRLAALKPNDLAGHGPDLLTSVMDWKAASGRAMLDRLEALVVGQVPEAGPIYRELCAVRREQFQIIMRGPGTLTPEAYFLELELYRREVENLSRQLANTVRGYAAFRAASQATPAEVAAQLPPNAVLIEFVYLEKLNPLFTTLPPGVTADAHYLALVVSRNPDSPEPTVQLVPLGSATKLEAVIERWRDVTRHGRRDATVDDELRRHIWDRISRVLPVGTEQLIIAPAGNIALVPFEAVWLKDDRKFLIERFRVSYCTTGRDLIARADAPTGPGAPVVVGDPAFDHRGFAVGTGVKPQTGTRPPSPVSSALAFAVHPPRVGGEKGFPVEARAVSALLARFRPQTPAEVLLGTDATEDRVGNLTRPELLYFITHGDFLELPKTRTLPGPLAGGPPTRDGGDDNLVGSFGEDPRLRGFLCLTGYNHWRERAERGLSDGLLTAREVEGLDLWGTELVVTAACKTGVGEVLSGEGMLSLRRAFQQAGARTVVGSLWSVPDEHTAKLMPRFLELWLLGTPKAEALRKAQLELIAKLRELGEKDSRYSDAPPYFWAGFVCHGMPK